MTDASGEVSAQERRALWIEVARWPLKDGMLGGVIALVVLAYASAQFEGGTSDSQRETRQMLLWIVAGPALFAALGHYAWRAVSCTYPAERPVPWGGDPHEDATLGQRVTTFAVVSAVSFAPMLLWTSLRGPLGAPGWADGAALAATSLVAAAMFPLGLAGAVVRGTPLAAMPGPVLRMWKADPRAARIAAATALVFVGLLFVSSWIGTSSNRASDAGMADPSTLGAAARAAKDSVSDVARRLIFAMRAAGFYAALVSFRVAGLLVRDVPAVREAVL